jgi:hypothetical protein
VINERRSIGHRLIKVLEARCAKVVASVGKPVFLHIANPPALRANVVLRKDERALAMQEVHPARNICTTVLGET